MNNIVVSFCIATFQRYEILKELIMEILSVDSDQFEIIVCDDHSMDGSIEKIKQIHDQRLKVYINDTNVGSLQNIYESLNRGNGTYLFYLNDRDNIDSFKIKKLISLLEKLKNENVAFIQCINFFAQNREYQIFYSGEEALLNFACKVTHPTGYIFLKKAWDEIANLKKIFENQYYSDYPATMVCAVMAQKYNGALIFGNICDVSRHRIDFSKEKSGFYLKRKDKRVWYSPEVQCRELVFGYKFLRQLRIEEEVLNKFICERYREYFDRVLIQYKENISKPENTTHYNLEVPKNPVSICARALCNGLYMWIRIRKFCRKNNKRELLKQINQDTLLGYCRYFCIVYKDILRAI